jgi:hypothetical protein
MTLALPLFAVTLFVSAFLLFLIQPMIGKMILPKLGGTPQVWNTCMVFFQAALLAGYFYTHAVSTRLKLRYQLLLHGLILFLPLIALLPGGPFNITGWVPPPGANPIPSTLLLLAGVVGLPFFVVATSAPLLQRWFAYTGHPAAKDPYFLYGASNLGSMLALLAYPTIVEPLFSLRSLDFDPTSQNWFWTMGYVVLGALVLTCAGLVFTTPAHVHEAADKASEEALKTVAVEQTAIKAGAAPAKEPVTSIKAATGVGPRSTGFQKGKHGKKKGQAHSARPTVAVKHAPTTARVAPVTVPQGPFQMTWWRRLRWIGLAAVPTSLMLGVTTYMSTDISAIPLLWIVPLTLYLLTFILVFMRRPVMWLGDPHRIVLFCQPFAILALAFILLTHMVTPLWITIPLLLFGFFLTALACHGELAADRPPTKYLTEFYLLMSVGGVVGGIFNAIVAPILFSGVWEFPIALVVACLMRPPQHVAGWLDDVVLGLFPEWRKKLEAHGRDTDVRLVHQEQEKFYRVVDVIAGLLMGVLVLLLFFAWSGLGFQKLATQFWSGSGVHPQALSDYLRKSYHAFVFGIPLVFCYVLKNRPLRMALGLGALLLVSGFHERGNEPGTRVLRAQRSYFGVLRVYETVDLQDKQSGEPTRWYTYLMHGTTHHGLNYQFPPQLRRLATTYYHRRGPAGVIMEPFVWFKESMESENPYASDARILASMVGLGANPLNLSAVPFEQIACAWTEPPYATVGLGTGTMASYCRPFQHLAYYEIDEKIRHFSLPRDGTEMTFDTEDPSSRNFPEGRQVFNYVHDAMKRGGIVEIIMGDARQSMSEERKRPPEELNYPGGNTFANMPKREQYYAAIFVDAFSSDAIPVHLITQEAIEMYFEKIRDNGVLCLHTSNRHVDLVKPITDVAHKLKLAYRVGNDLARDHKELGHFTSEWVMLARKSEYLPSGMQGGPRWETPPPPGNRVWTDDFSNLVGVLRW